MMGLENPVHILFVLAVVLMVFGAKRLPEMGRGLGEGFRGFRDAVSGGGARPEAELGAGAPSGEETPAAH
jgi:sec-independent protein translocase protein TatA